MKHSKQQVAIKVTEFTALIHSVVADPQIGNSSDMFRTITTHVRSLSPEDYDKVNKAYKKKHKQDLKAIFGSSSLGSTNDEDIFHSGGFKRTNTIPNI